MITAPELKAYIAAQLHVPVAQVAKIIDSYNKVIDFITSINEDDFPAWTLAATFKLDGTPPGRYCKHPDADGNIRIFETKIDNNNGHEPPTSPSSSENAFWKEISSSISAALPEWSAGVYGTGLKVVFHNHSVDQEGLYLLGEPVRPFNSTDIEAEITGGKWKRIGGAQQKFTANPTISVPSFGKYENGDVPNWIGLTPMEAILDAITDVAPGSITMDGSDTVDGSWTVDQ